MSRVLPNFSIQNDRRIETLDVVTFVNHPTPPRLLDVVVELDAHWAIVPRAAEAAVDFGRGIDEAATLRERDDRFDVRCRQAS